MCLFGPLAVFIGSLRASVQFRVAFSHDIPFSLHIFFLFSGGLLVGVGYNFLFFLLPQCVASICSFFFFIQLLDSTHYNMDVVSMASLLVTDSLSTSLYLYFENISLANKKMKQTTVYNKVNS